MSLEAGDKLIPLGDASFLARGMTVKVADNCVKDTGNQATVYGAPSSFIELSIAGQTVGTANTNALGHAQISFDIPEEVTQGLLFGDYVKLDAKSGQVDAHLDCFYRPGAKIKTFSITNAGKTQTRIVDGKETYDNLTVLYQLPKKKNAYWTFDVRLTTPLRRSRRRCANDVREADKWGNCCGTSCPCIARRRGLALRGRIRRPRIPGVA